MCKARDQSDPYKVNAYKVKPSSYKAMNRHSPNVLFLSSNNANNAKRSMKIIRTATTVKPTAQFDQCMLVLWNFKKLCPIWRFWKWEIALSFSLFEGSRHFSGDKLVLKCVNILLRIVGTIFSSFKGLFLKILAF